MFHEAALKLKTYTCNTCLSLNKANVVDILTSNATFNASLT